MSSGARGRQFGCGRRIARHTVPIAERLSVATIPFRQGAAEIVAWYERHPEAQMVDEQRDRLLDTMIAAYESVAPGTSSTTEEQG